MSVHILVVDDEVDVASLFRQRFRREVRDGRIALDFARSADEALRKVERGGRRGCSGRDQGDREGRETGSESAPEA